MKLRCATVLLLPCLGAFFAQAAALAGSYEAFHTLPEEAYPAEAHQLLELPELLVPKPPEFPELLVPKSPELLIPKPPELGSAARWVERLRWPGASSDQQAFMRRVYLRQMERAAARRKAFANLSASQLADIEGGQKAQQPVARSCRALLQAARADLGQDRAHRSVQARSVSRIGVLSAYRSIARQFGNWQSNFPNYYRQTIASRQGQPDGAHGEAATDRLAAYIEQRLAAPGYSFHNGGTAIDFTTVEGGRQLQALTDPGHIRSWRQSWFFRWMSRNAERFHLYQNTSIDEPWHWEFR